MRREREGRLTRKWISEQTIPQLDPTAPVQVRIQHELQYEPHVLLVHLKHCAHNDSTLKTLRNPTLVLPLDNVDLEERRISNAVAVDGCTLADGDEGDSLGLLASDARVGRCGESECRVEGSPEAVDVRIDCTHSYCQLYLLL
jgi:hypothetical protein